MNKKRVSKISLKQKPEEFSKDELNRLKKRSPLFKENFESPAPVDVEDEILQDDLKDDRTILPYGIGIDTHSRFIQICLLIRADNKIKRIEKEYQCLWPMLLEARDWLHSMLSHHVKNFNPSDMHYCIESTSTYHFPIVQAIGGAPRIVNPALTGGVRRKTDVLDARMLAHQSLSNMWRKSFFPSIDLINLRILISHRKRWTRQKTMCTNRLNNIILRYGYTPFAKANFGTYTRPIIEDLIAGRTPQVDTASDIPLPHETRIICQDLVSTWDNCEEKVKYYTKQILKVVHEMDFPVTTGFMNGKELMKFLQSVPGIGEMGSVIWLSEIYDVERFPNSKACSAYCGCDPSLRVSAGKVTSHKTRGGNRTVYTVLLQAASSLIQRRKEVFGSWGYRLYSTNRKGGWKKACCAVARRLSVALYQVHKRCEPFSYDSYHFWREIEVPDIPLEQMNLGSFPEKKLRNLGLLTSTQVVESYYKDLALERGIGEKCLQPIQVWINNQKKTRTPQHPQQKQLLTDKSCSPAKDSGSPVRSSTEKGRKSRTRIWSKTPTPSS